MPRESSDKNFSKSHGKVEKPIGDRGFPRLRHVSVPGYNKGTGTPGYVGAAAKRAESYMESCGTGGGKQGETPSHRLSGHYDTGAPPRGSAPRLQDPDKRVRETK